MPKDNLPQVEVVHPTVAESLPRRIELTAIVEPAARVDLCARVPGVVKSFSDGVDIGRRIKKGEVLAVLDVPDLIAQRDLKRAGLGLARLQKEQVAETRKVLAQEVEESRHLARKFEAEFNARSDEYARTRMLVERNAQAPEVAQEKLRIKEAAQAAWEASQAQALTKAVKLKAGDVDERVAASKIQVVEAEIQSLEVQITYATLDGAIRRRGDEAVGRAGGHDQGCFGAVINGRAHRPGPHPDGCAGSRRGTRQRHRAEPEPRWQGRPGRPALPIAGRTGHEWQNQRIHHAQGRGPRFVHANDARRGSDRQSGRPAPAGNVWHGVGIARAAPRRAARFRRPRWCGEPMAMTCSAWMTCQARRRGAWSERGRCRRGSTTASRVEILSGLTADSWVITKRSSVVALGDEVRGVPAARP